VNYISDYRKQLREKLEGLSRKWQSKGLPSRSGLEKAAGDLREWKVKTGGSGLWDTPPLMITATLDDGLGHGLEVIRMFSETAGLEIIELGLLVTPDKIIAACKKNKPDLLGLTVLQFDSEENILMISRNLPSKTKIIAGGPVFTADREFARRTGIHFVAKNVAHFIRFLLEFEKITPLISESRGCLRLHHQGCKAIMNIDKRLEEAVKIYNEILEKDPSDSKAYYNLGCVFDELGNIDASLDSFKAAIKIDPDNKDAQYALGSAYLKKGNSKEALLNLCPVAGNFPADARLYHEIGQAWHGLNSYEKAKGAYKRAIDINPRFAEAYYDLACADLGSKEFVDAIDGFNKFLEFDKKNKFALTNLAKAYFSMGEIDEAIRLYNETATEYASINIATIIPGSPRANHQDILNARRALNKITRPPKKRQKYNKRLSVGYISSFFHRPNWMKPVWSLLNNHDRSKFKIFIFSDAPENKVVKSEEGYILFEEDEFFNIENLNNQQTAELINSCNLDILVDLNGYSEVNRLALFSSFIMEPVTVAWFNMYATSGLEGYDYLIGDKHVIHEDEKKYYTENIIELPLSYLTFNVNYKVPDVAPPPCLKNGCITFGSLSSQYKITPRMIESWSYILSNSPGSKLIIRNANLTSIKNREYIFDKFKKYNMGKDRLTLLGKAEHYQFLETYNMIDIALDSFPYNGGTTTTEAIWQGVPVVTFDGDRWVSRTSKTILINTHLSEYIRKDLDDYISFSIGLANDPNTPGILKDIRINMRDKIKNSSVYNANKFAALMEHEFCKIIGR
jgi:protein O-GlcNAc transferase